MEEALAGGVSLYPDPEMNRLRDAVVLFWRKKGVNINRKGIVFGDSADEIINMIAEAFITEGDEVIISENSFSLYSICSASKGAVVKEIPRKDFKVDLDGIAERANFSERSKLVMFSNPDNPTSTFHGSAAINDFMKKIPPRTAVLLDEAYIDFAGTENSFLPGISRYQNLIIAYTFSKNFGLAGLRVGYAVMEEKLAEQIDRIRLPFNLGTLQQCGAAAALEDENFIKRTLSAVEDGKNFLERELERLGIRYPEPHGNFIFVDLGPKSSSIREHLEKNGITIRPLLSFGLPENFFRISVGSMEANRYLIEKIDEIINT
jgi:histidinol-phosphate aminotransferase